MKWTTELKELVVAYSRAVLEGNAAVFAGAGLSRPAGFVDWRNLLRGVASDLGLDIEKEHDLISVAQYHENEKRNRHKINQLLLDEFCRTTAPTENHRILSLLPISTYWTTNYDTVIEQGLRDAGKTSDVKITSENLATTLSKRDAVVFKMHGDVSQPDKAVLTKDDYEGYDKDRELFTTALRGDLVSKTFLFLGFSFSDPNIGFILAKIRVLLGKNQRTHYCVLKRALRGDFKTTAEFNYAAIKQKLQINDLKRYGISAILVDNYADVSVLLSEIRRRVLRKTVFISGSADEYNGWSQDEAFDFVFALSREVAANGFRVATGFGRGVGSAVINGVLDYVYSTEYRHLDNHLLLRPFPQPRGGKAPDRALWKKYRGEILADAGVVIFLFGNKQDNAGKIVSADGVLQEFEIASQSGAAVVPVGATGYASRSIWETVMADPNKYLPTSRKVKPLLTALGKTTKKPATLIPSVSKLLKEIREG